MKFRFRFMTIALFCLLAACVTINIYFPAAAAEKVADQIIDEIQTEGINQPGLKPDGTPDTLPAEEEDDPFSKNNHGILETVIYALLNTLVSEAHAAEADLNADSPQVRQLKNSMRARYSGLKQFYAKGWVGLQNDGLIVVRNPGDIALAMRSQVKQLVAAENNDRRALYQAIAVANGHPEWAQQIQQTFARRWIAKAQPTWWYNDGSGWKQR
ncbi:MAG: YdbL family protein [Methylococcales bacterium]